jgi:hypothetical protein
MAVGLSTAAASNALDDLTAGYTWVQLHTADPGAAGTTAIANETDRIQVTSWTGTGAARSNGNALTWTGVTVSSGTQDYTHITLWSASTSGSFGYSGTVTANPVSNGDTFQIPIGDLDISFPVAA